MHVTINDIARLAGFSKATVSSVLNNRPGIAMSTRERVLALVQKLNYRPNQLARSLSIQKTRSIGLVIKEIDNPYFAKIVKGVYDACSHQAYTVLLGSSELAAEKELSCIETLVNQQVDGLIISPLQGDDVNFSYLANLIREKRPFVMLSAVKNFQTHTVDVDNIHAAYNAVSYLIRMGHTRIAYFSGPSHSLHSEERLIGYQRAFSDNGLPFRQEDVLPTGSYIDNGYQQGLRLYGRKADLPSAVLCYNDLVAIGLIQALLELGLNVPGEVSVVGFDNIEFCRYMKVPLTTVDIPAYEIGQQAAEMLIRLMNDSVRDSSEKRLIPTRLIERTSVAKRT